MKSRFASLSLMTLAFLLLARSAIGADYVSHNSYPFNSPLAYRDSDTSIIVYVETDGTHVSAIDHQGKLLWTKDFEQLGRYYMPDFLKGTIWESTKPPPKIMSLRPTDDGLRDYAKSHGVAHGAIVTFNTTVFGMLNIDDGTFSLMGQD